MIILVLFSLTLVSAESLLAELSLDQSTFDPGDVFDVTLELRNIAGQEQDIEIHGSTFAELDGSVGLIRDVEDTLATDETKIYHVYTITIPEDHQEGRHTVSVIILSEFGEKIELQQDFTVKNTLKEFDIDLSSCPRTNCDDQRVVFRVNEEVSLDSLSDTGDVKVSATIEYPDGAVKNIEFPLTTKLNQLGLYTIRMTATKKGYLPISKVYYLSALQTLPSYKTEDDQALAAYGYGTPSNEIINQPKGLDNTIAKEKRNIFADLFNILRNGPVGQVVRMITDKI